jgi:hypothetical protein
MSTQTTTATGTFGRGIEEMRGGADPTPWPGEHMNRHVAASGAAAPADPTQGA